MQIKRERWYGSIVEYLNRKAAELLAAGKITKSQHDLIIKENRRQHKAQKRKGFVCSL